MEYCVVMTTHNSSQYIRKTLTSIIKKLEKEPPQEILIFDDCSMDDTREEINFVSSLTQVPIRFFSSSNHEGAKSNIAVALFSSLKKHRFVLYCQDDVFALDDKDLLEVVKMNARNPDVAITCPYVVLEQEINFENQIYHMRKVIGGQRTLVSGKCLPADLQFWFLYEIKETRDMVKGFLSTSLGKRLEVGLANRFCFCVDRKFANNTRFKIEEALHHKSMLDDWFLQIKFLNGGKIWLLPPIAVGHLKNTELFYSPDTRLFEEYWNRETLSELSKKLNQQQDQISRVKVQILRKDSLGAF